MRSHLTMQVEALELEAQRVLAEVGRAEQRACAARTEAELAHGLGRDWRPSRRREEQALAEVQRYSAELLALEGAALEVRAELDRRGVHLAWPEASPRRRW